MLATVRFFTRLIELTLAIPLRSFRFIIGSIAFNPKLGPLRYLVQAALFYLIFAICLVYVAAPIRGITGGYYRSEKLRYDAERWLATAIYDRNGNFVGTYDPRLDSRRDVNYTNTPVSFDGYTANPDHKSIPVRKVPEAYWQCLVHLEDRNLGTWINPFGIDLIGVLKIPYSAITRSIALGRPTLGVGGSTLPMQLARIIYKTPPSIHESTIEKIRRKFSEWSLAPVIYHELTRRGDDTPFRHWTANHLWLAQRTGGQSLHGVEVTSQIVFGKEAKDLTIAEQFVLAAAVNKPIILLEGSKTLNAVRLDRWRYIIEVRARLCAERLLTDEDQQKQAIFELVRMAGGPPDPHVRPGLQKALERHQPGLANRAEANPIFRANSLMPAARLGIREEMKQTFGFDWRSAVRGITSTLDVAANLDFRQRIEHRLKSLQEKWSARLKPGFTLDLTRTGDDRRRPDIIVVAANQNGHIIRYFESNQTSPYFGSSLARNRENGIYRPAAEPRQIASTGKTLAAIAIATHGRDTIHSPYVDELLPATTIESCKRTTAPRPIDTGRRRAIVAFACSLNRPIEWRLARIGQSRVRKLIETFHFTMPPSHGSGDRTPPSTAAVRGLISGSPQRVHQMSAVVLAALTNSRRRSITPPTLVKDYDFTSPDSAKQFKQNPHLRIKVDDAVPARARALVKSLLSAPLCQVAYGRTIGTLKSIDHWCSTRRKDVTLHFAKTGTSVTADPDETVDTWITGGIQFKNGSSYSYVVVIGTGSGNRPWARSLHAGQVAAPLADTLLRDLADHARRAPQSSPPPHTAAQEIISKRQTQTSKVANHQNLFDRWGINPFAN